MNDLVEQVYSDVKELIEALKEFKGKSWTEMIPLFVELVKAVIEKVEFYKDLTGEEKREIAVGVLNKAVDIPMLPEFMEERVFGLLVDVTVNLLNNFFGKNWLQDMPKN